MTDNNIPHANSSIKVPGQQSALSELINDLTLSANLRAHVIFDKVTYYALTIEQINTFASLSWIISFCVFLLSLSFECWLGCWIAVAQGIIPKYSETINIVKWVSGSACILIFVFTTILLCIQIYQKRHWLRNSLIPENSS